MHSVGCVRASDCGLHCGGRCSLRSHLSPSIVWNAAIPALDIVVHEVPETISLLETRQRSHARGPIVAALFHEPHLVALDVGRQHDRGIVGREDDLGVLRIGLLIAEHGY